MLLRIKVKVGNKPVEEKDGYLIVYTSEPREGNRANIDLIKQLSRYYNKNFKDVRIIRGEKSRNKIVEIL
jgi:uncharacterized protein YggU (UPF0235/DUF167 family)